MAFTINNISSSTIGPYNGVSIESNQSYAVSDPVALFALNAYLISDCYLGKVSITFGNLDFVGFGAAQLLFQLSLSSYIGKINVAAPSFGVQNTSVYNTSLPAATGGQLQAIQSNQFAELAIQYRNKYSNLTGNATTTVKSGSGRLHAITINDNTTCGTITVYDNTAASGTKIGTFQIGSPSGGLLSSTGQLGPVMIGPLGCEFSTGLTVVTAGSTSNNITIYYQ